MLNYSRQVMLLLIGAVTGGCEVSGDLERFLGHLPDGLIPAEEDGGVEASFPASPCDQDFDGDGYGDGCPLGPDCDDAYVDVNPGAAERCDGRDNDCDNAIDEDFDLDSPCTVGLGACIRPGVVACSGSGFGDCVASTPEMEPTPELCNGVDDDCDGIVDEQTADAGGDCDAGVCGIGVTVCTGGALSCQPANAVGAEECNGLDDDCDGQVDESPDGSALARACYFGPPGTAGIGLCAEGLETCSQGLFQGCSGQILPGAETCNGDDDDCDGFVDEGIEVDGQPCTVGLGLCSRAGIFICQGGDLLCTAEAAAPSPEICNALDDDCDGATDERADGSPLADLCFDGPAGAEEIGACSAGSRRCVDGIFTACLNQVLPGPELCDGIDNDCDGTVDESAAGTAQMCTVGTGACSAPGVTVCVEGVGVVCDAIPGVPSEEVCDNLDNDCDGLFDEACTPDSGPAEDGSIGDGATDGGGPGDDGSIADGATDGGGPEDGSFGDSSLDAGTP